MSPEGVEVSRLVYGTWRLLADAEGAAPEPLVRRLQLCVERGITTVEVCVRLDLCFLAHLCCSTRMMSVRK